jgi:DNA polymerase-3 subunit beta
MGKLELILDRGAFLNALFKAQGVVDRKSTGNVLSNLRLETISEDRVTLTGTDFDVILRAELSATIKKEGIACINGKSLFDVVKNVTDDQIHLKQLENNWIELEAGRSRFKLAGIDAADFPEIAKPEPLSWVSVPRSILKDFIEKTAFSVSNDETRMNLNGVFLRLLPADDGKCRLTLVSTDGHRLSKVEADLELQGYEGQTFQAIVHKKGVQEIKRLLDDDVEEIGLGFAPGHVVFSTGSTAFTVRQIEDSYPDFDRVIPTSAPQRININRQRMIQAIKRIAIITSTKTYIVKMEIENGKMVFISSTPDYGEGRDEIDIDYTGETITIGYNYSYLLDVLQSLRSDDVTLELSDEYGPTVITAPSEPGALFVVMPMRI